MKKITTILLMMGIVTISACASNEADMDTARSDAEMAQEKAAMEAEKAEQKAEQMRREAENKAKMEKMEADRMRMEAEKERMEAAAAAGEESTEMESASSSTTSNLVSTCTHGNQTRIISVVYDNDATDTVCEVTYEKSTGIQTLWTAISDRQYCSDRAVEFVEKQEGWGWSCTELN